MTRPGWSTLALALAALLCVALASRAAQGFARSRPAEDAAAELTLFPSGKLLTEASLGHRLLTADLAWLTAIQYYGKHRLSDRRYPLAAHLFQVVTDADPEFRNAYLLGALVLAENGELDAAAALLCKGVRANPHAWRLWFELGFFHYVFTRDYDEAALALRIAGRLPGAEEYVTRFAAEATQRAGDPRLAAELWEAIARGSANDEVRRIAEERLAALAGGH
jgi:tetratricopeptide (TPR) repeat protein